MNLQWPSLVRDLMGSALAMDRQIECVLIEYDGPKLALFRGSDRMLYIGVVSDMEPGRTRWLQSEISDLEFGALRNGDQSVREALRKDTIWVVDIEESGKAIDAWPADSAAISAAAFPDKDTRITRDMVDAIDECYGPSKAPAASLQAPQILLGGVPVIDHSLEMDDLSDFYKQFQRVCMAGAANYKARQRLPHAVKSIGKVRVTPAWASSYAFAVRPSDDYVYEMIMQEYDGIVEASDDEYELRSALGRMPAAKAAVYLNFLRSVAAVGLEVYCRRRRRGSFLTPDSARRIRAKAVSILSPGAPTDDRPFSAKGYFRALSYGLNTGQFRFVDPVRETEYRGLVSAALIYRLENEISVPVGALEEVQAHLKLDLAKPSQHILMDVTHVERTS